MIPILYDTNETAFISNGLGRLRDTISAVVTEERNGIYELEFEYPVTGANFDLIKVGRIVGVTHDDTGDVEPFDIVSYSRPINGVVTFHCTHISYRLSYCTVTGSNINSLSAAFTLFGNASPSMPFVFQTDKTSTGYMAAADGTPRSVRELMGGVEGSILDAYGGEYSFNNWNVYLHSARGQTRDFSIRYGVNMLNYDEDYDATGTFSACVPFWTDGTETVVGSRQTNGSATITGRGETVPLDLSDKFETKPTVAQVEAAAVSYMNSNNTSVPKQTIKVEFVRLQDLGFDWLDNLLTCELCDTINVIFPDYNSTGQFKIVKTVWDVLNDRFESMELGELATTLAEALGITNGLGGGSGSQIEPADYIVEEGTINTYTKYRKWNGGRAECWYSKSTTGITTTVWTSPIYYMDTTVYASIWNGLFNAAPSAVFASTRNNQIMGIVANSADANGVPSTRFLTCGAKSNLTATVQFYAVGTWK